MTVFRLNMSHGEHAGHQAAYDHIRLIAERLVKPIAVLADLCGPKIRTGKFEGDGIDLLEGDEIKIIMGQGLGGVGQNSSVPATIWTSVASAASKMSKNLGARAFIVVSTSGITPQTMSTARPAAPILAITGSQRVFNRTSLLWGVAPLLDTRAGKVNPNELAKQLALDLGLTSPGQFVLLIRGFHQDPAMNLPSVTVITITEEDATE